jgi:hypothetical protein
VLCRSSPAIGSSPWKAVDIVRGVDDSPKAIHDADKGKDDEGLANPLRQRAAVSLHLAAGYRGRLRGAIGSKGAVVGRWANKQGGGLQTGGIVVGGRRFVWRGKGVYVVVVVMVVDCWRRGRFGLGLLASRCEACGSCLYRWWCVHCCERFAVDERVSAVMEECSCASRVIA